MNKNNGVSSEAQGAEDVQSKSKVLTLDDVKRMVARDLPTCVSFLNACIDPTVQEQVAIFLHGQYLNAKHKSDLELQQELELTHKSNPK